MTELNRALYQLWSSFGLPAYLSGNVPDGAELPWITFDVIQGEPMSAAFLTVGCWFRHAPPVDGQTARAALLDRISDAIPTSGLKIPLEGGGFVMLYRNAGSWQNYIVDEDDKTVIGGLVSCEIHYYNE